GDTYRYSGCGQRGGGGDQVRERGFRFQKTAYELGSILFAARGFGRLPFVVWVRQEAVEQPAIDSAGGGDAAAAIELLFPSSVQCNQRINHHVAGAGIAGYYFAFL